MKKVASYRHSRSPNPIVHCNRKVLGKEKLWAFRGKLYLPAISGTEYRPVIELAFEIGEPMVYQEAVYFAVVAIREEIRDYPQYEDYEWSMSIVTEGLTTTPNVASI